MSEILNCFKFIGLKNLKDYEKLSDYKEYSISIYDSWLNEDDYSKNLHSYYQILNGEFNLKDYLIYEKKYIEFFDILFSNMTVYTFDNDYDFTKNLTKVTSRNKLKEMICICLREKRAYNFIIPHLETIIFKNYDLTLPIFIKPNNKEIFNIINQANLFLLKGTLYKE
ncbi:MAG: hypothetical protein GY830_00975 [Bacteroidetes bacterium]|nr:hypothetical protein [Bacteroidota bacterium]